MLVPSNSKKCTGVVPCPGLGLAANSTYYFVVRARDAAGNRDLNKVMLSATTLA